MDKDEKRLLLARFVYFHLDQVGGPALELDKDEKRLLLARFVYFHLDQVVGPSSWTKMRSDFS